MLLGGWPRRVLPLFWIAVAYTTVLCTRYQLFLTADLTAEDAAWVRGDLLGNALRLTAGYTYNQLILPLFGDRLMGYKLPGLLLHLANALLLHILFVALFRRVSSQLARDERLIQLGGFLAGLTFLFIEPGTVSYHSALSYQLASFFSLLTLLTLLFSTMHLARPGYATPLLAATAYGLALISHAYTVALPLFVLLLEPLLCRARPLPRRLLATGILLGGMGVSFALFIGHFRGWLLGYGWGGMIKQAGRESLPVALVMGPFNVLYKALLPMGAEEAYLTPALLPLYLVLWVVIIGAALFRFFRRTPALGLSGVLLLFFLGWNTMCFLQEFRTGVAYSTFWRAYFNNIGLAMCAGYLAALVLRAGVRAARRSTFPPRGFALGSGAALVLYLLFNPMALASFALLPGNIQKGMARRACLTHEVCPAPGVGPCVDHRQGKLSVAHLAGKMLKGARFTGAVLSSADMKAAQLDRACLAFATMHHANLDNTRLQGASFYGAKGLKASFRKADMTRARLDSADLTHSRMAGATLIRATARRAVLEDADLSHVAADEAMMEAAYLHKARLDNASFRKANLNYAALTGASMKDAVLTGCSLKGANLSGADLRGADLRGADLRGADLRGANLLGANLQGARLRGARLDTPWPPAKETKGNFDQPTKFSQDSDR